MSLTAELGKFIAGISYDAVPAEMLPTIRMAFTDTVAVMLVGASEAVTQAARALATPSAAPEARACLSSLRVSALDAAVIGGTAAHAMDYDDQSLTGHPSAVLVPAILAEGERLNADGRSMMAAYVAGYEVWADLVRRSIGYHSRGWHPTAVFGVVGAAAACAALNRLSAERAATTISVAASHASGLSAAIGTMTKPYHAGKAARDGVASARLAAAGIVAAPDTIEGLLGFLTAFAPGDTDRLPSGRLGRTWYMPQTGLCIKLHPTCYFMHRSFVAARDLAAARGIKPDDVEQVSVVIGRGEADVQPYHQPRLAHEARFSSEFAIAAGIVLGRMGVAELSDAVVQRADMQAFYPKVKIVVIEEHDEREPAMAPYTQVAVRLKDGTGHDSGRLTHIHGHAWDPVTRDELWAKFQECSARSHGATEAWALFDMCMQIDRLESARALPGSDKVFASG